MRFSCPLAATAWVPGLAWLLLTAFSLQACAAAMSGFAQPNSGQATVQRTLLLT